MSDKYKAIHLNVSREKYASLIRWLEEQSDAEDRTLASFIVRILKKEYDRHEEKEDEK